MPRLSKAVLPVLCSLAAVGFFHAQFSVKTPEFTRYQDDQNNNQSTAPYEAVVETVARIHEQVMALDRRIQEMTSPTKEQSNTLARIEQTMMTMQQQQPQPQSIANKTEEEHVGESPFFLRMGAMPDLNALRTCSASSSLNNNVSTLRTQENMLNSFPSTRMMTPALQDFWNFVAESQKIPKQNETSSISHHNDDCNDPKSMEPHYNFVQKLDTRSHTGLGARLRIMTSGFGYALMRNMTFTAPGPWLWTDEKACPARDHACYFQEPQGQGFINGTLCSERGNSSDAENTMVTTDGAHYAQSGVYEMSKRFNLPPFRINCELLFFLMQPNPRLQMDIEEAARLLDWHHLPRPILTVHVRHGKKSAESEYYPTEDYLQAVATMKERHGFRSVFLITDDRNASDTFAQTIPTLGFEALVSLDAPEYVQTGWDKQFQTKRDAALRVLSGNSPACYEAVTALLNIYIGALSDGFVGTFNSNLGRAILKLLYARHGSMPPNVGLDKFYTAEDAGSCYHDNVCIKRHTILVRTKSEEYPMTTAILE